MMANRSHQGRRYLKYCTQSGQALAESLFALMGLTALWVAVHWLSHYQDAALSARHASRHAAFAATRFTQPDDTVALTVPFFTGAAHRWKNRHGASILDPHTSVNLLQFRLQPLSAAAQPAAGSVHGPALRRDWQLDDNGMVQTRVLLSLPVFDEPYPVLARNTVILTAAGHASSDIGVHSRIAASALAWQSAYTTSRIAASEVNARALGVEAGWGRSAATLDWLQPWSGRVPPHLITEFEPLKGDLS